LIAALDPQKHGLVRKCGLHFGGEVLRVCDRLVVHFFDDVTRAKFAIGWPVGSHALDDNTAILFADADA
jgi:hypothetical protein